MNISDKIKHLREKSGLTQRQLADELGVPYSTFRAYETSGEKAPPVDVVMKICRRFSVSADYLLGLAPAEGLPPVSVPEELRADAASVMKAAAALCEREGSRPYPRSSLPVFRQILQQLDDLIAGSDEKYAALIASSPEYARADRPGRLPEELRDKLLAQTVEGSVDPELLQLARAGSDYSAAVEALVHAAVIKISALLQSSLGPDLGASSSVRFSVPAIK